MTYFIINYIISKVKGEKYSIDKNIPLSYLLSFFSIKFISLLYGIFKFHHLKKIFIHPYTTIKCTSKIKVGNNFSVASKCHIDALSEKGLRCGDNVSIGYATHIELTGSLKLLGKGMDIGNNVGMGSHGFYGSGAGFVEIGDNTIMGNFVSIHPENHITKDLTKPIRKQGVYSRGGVKIGKDCWIGAKVTILDGTELGDGCIVAAGAVVTGKFPDYSIIGGIPAKIIKMRK